MKHSPKLAILQSLDALDQVQMESVLEYIKDVLRAPEKVDKKEAMKEIRRALKQTRKPESFQFA